MFPVDTLNRWQRMRFLTLAVGCGADPAKLSAAPSQQQEQQQKRASYNCTICNTLLPTSHERRIPFASPTRSLIDKHYDALAQAISELDLSEHFGVSTVPRTYRQQQQQQQQQQQVEVESLPGGGGHDVMLRVPMPAEGASVCFLCSLAQHCNAEERQHESEDGADDADSEEPKKIKKPWWWANTFDPSYVNMETGDIGGADPIEELVLRPTQMFAENCRYLLSSTAARLSKVLAAKLKRQQEQLEAGAKNDDEPEDDAGEQQQEEEQEEEEKIERSTIDAMAALAERFGNSNTVNITVRLDGSDAAQQPSFHMTSVSIPEGTVQQGFNRTKLRFAEGTTPQQQLSLLQSPFALQQFLTQFLHSTVRMFATAATTAKEPEEGDDKSNNEVNKLEAALTAAIFSDARRRQSTQNHNSGMNMMMMPGMQQVGMMMMPSIPGMSLPVTMAAGGGNGSGNGGVLEMLAALQQHSAVVQQQQQQAQQQQAPAPPFPLPLSLFEEMMVLRKPSAALEKLRHDVELLPAMNGDVFSDAPARTYNGEFTNALLEAI